MGEHLPYKQGVTGSSPVLPTNQKQRRFGRNGKEHDVSSCFFFTIAPLMSLFFVLLGVQEVEMM